MKDSNTAAATDPAPGTVPRMPRALIDVLVGDDLREAIERQMRERVPMPTAERAMVEAERARQAASRPSTASAPANTPAASSAARSVAVAERRAAEAYTASFADPERETEKVRQLYQKLIEARTETGEKAGAPNLKDFERFVLQKTKELKSKGNEEVEYTVSVEGGRVKLKARVSK